jgi:DNA-binding GntR family transcriptional regulator
MGHLPDLPAIPTRRTASDEVTDALRSAIIEGRFADGEELNQVELAGHFGLSRVPVREALRRLQAEGLVSAEPHRPVTVLGVNTERIGEIFEIRALLEAYMLERAAPALGPQALKRLHKLCDELDRTKAHDTWVKRNHAFHRALLEPSGAVASLTIVDQLMRQVERYVRRTGGVHRPEEAGVEHRQILAALEQDDVDGATAILREHILTTKDQVLEALGAATAVETGPTA